MTDEPIFRVRIEAATTSELRAFIDETGADPGCRAIARPSAAGFAIDAFLPESQLETARASRAASQVSLTIVENQTEVGRERQAEVGAGNRFAVRDAVPHGLGRKE